MKTILYSGYANSGGTIIGLIFEEIEHAVVLPMEFRLLKERFGLCDLEDALFKSKDPEIIDLARIAVTIFMLRFPSVQSFVNKGHPLVLATDEYMLENSNAQNWHDYKFIAEEFGWK